MGLAFPAVTIFLIRHATAGRRGFDQDDLERPLDEYGREQANALVGLLQHRQITEIHSSRAARCMQTVAPLGHAIGVPVDPEPSMLEGSSQARVLEFIRSLETRDVVLCSHGDIIPDAIRALEVGGTRIEGERSCAKGSIWELEANADGMIMTASYTPVEPKRPATA